MTSGRGSEDLSGTMYNSRPGWCSLGLLPQGNTRPCRLKNEFQFSTNKISSLLDKTYFFEIRNLDKVAKLSELSCESGANAAAMSSL